MITLKIDDAEIEHQLLELAKDQKKDLETLTIQAITAFIDICKEKKLVYQKKDMTKHVTVIQRTVDPNDLDQDIAPYAQVDDSSAYVKNLRNQRHS
jgi:hypothetical protein